MSREEWLRVPVRPQDLDKAFPFLRQPVIVGEFSLNSNREFVQDRSGLGYLAKPPPGKVELDLNKGLKRVVKKDKCAEGGAEGLSNLLQGILAHRARFAVDDELASLHTDLVCFRGLLTTLLLTPYEAREAWRVVAVRWKGTIYLMQQETEVRRRQREKESQRQKDMSSWGYKFEQYLTTSVPGTSPDTTIPVNENEEFCCMFRSRVGGLSLVYGAEMDAYKTDKTVEPKGSLKPDMFVEMKTSRQVENEKQDRSFRRFKLLKWWAQSFLVGTPEILCGWRDDDGVVSTLESFQVKELPKLGVDWQPNVCFNFLADLLGELRDKLSSDGLETVWEVEYVPWSGVRVARKRVGRGEEHPVLPEWYTGQIFQH